jgi:hypothetical protein
LIAGPARCIEATVEGDARDGGQVLGLQGWQAAFEGVQVVGEQPSGGALQQGAVRRGGIEAGKTVARDDELQRAGIGQFGVDRLAEIDDGDLARCHVEADIVAVRAPTAVSAHGDRDVIDLVAPDQLGPARQPQRTEAGCGDQDRSEVPHREAERVGIVRHGVGGGDFVGRVGGLPSLQPVFDGQTRQVELRQRDGRCHSRRSQYA